MQKPPPFLDLVSQFNLGKRDFPGFFTYVGIKGDESLIESINSTELYRHYDKDGVLLYVGISLSSTYRFSQHKTNSEWFKLVTRIEIERFKTRKEAVKAEEQAIKDEHPKYNVQFNDSYQDDVDWPRYIVKVEKLVNGERELDQYVEIDAREARNKSTEEIEGLAKSSLGMDQIKDILNQY